MISVIVPTLNEEKHIEATIKQVNEVLNKISFEIIVVDGGSTDSTLALLHNLNVKIIRCKRGRAIQLNTGALAARGNYLYFLHADSAPDLDCATAFNEAIKNKIQAATFRIRFNPSNPVLWIYSQFSALPFIWCRGGDQSLWITKSLFLKLGMFDPRFQSMEDIDFIKRLNRHIKLKIFSQRVQSSSRKFLINGYIRLQLVYALMHLKYWLNSKSPQQINATYAKYIK